MRRHACVVFSRKRNSETETKVIPKARHEMICFWERLLFITFINLNWPARRIGREKKTNGKMRRRSNVKDEGKEREGGGVKGGERWERWKQSESMQICKYCYKLYPRGLQSEVIHGWYLRLPGMHHIDRVAKTFTGDHPCLEQRIRELCCMSVAVFSTVPLFSKR